MLVVVCFVREVLICCMIVKEREKYWKMDDEKVFFWFGIIFINGWVFCGVFGIFYWVIWSMSGGIVLWCLSGLLFVWVCYYSWFEVCVIIYFMVFLIKLFYKIIFY